MEGIEARDSDERCRGVGDLTELVRKANGLVVITWVCILVGTSTFTSFYIFSFGLSLSLSPFPQTILWKAKENTSWDEFQHHLFKCLAFMIYSHMIYRLSFFPKKKYWIHTHVCFRKFILFFCHTMFITFT